MDQIKIVPFDLVDHTKPLTDPAISVGRALQALKDNPDRHRDLRVRYQDLGRRARLIDRAPIEACPFPSHSFPEKWWIEGWSGLTSAG